MTIIQRVVSILFARGQSIAPSNPMGWVPMYGGDWADVASDWEDTLKHCGDGLFVNRADGACPSRLVGVRSDGRTIFTAVASADMVSHADHRARLYSVRALAHSTRLIWQTGIPDTMAGVDLAVERLMDLHVREVQVDVSGRNWGDVCLAFMGKLEDLVVAGELDRVYFEPLVHPALQGPDFTRRIPGAGLPGVYQIPQVAVPDHSIIIHNGNNPLTPELEAQWASLDRPLTLAIARGQAIEELKPDSLSATAWTWTDDEVEN